MTIKTNTLLTIPSKGLIPPSIESLKLNHRSETCNNSPETFSAQSGGRFFRLQLAQKLRCCKVQFYNRWLGIFIRTRASTC